MMDAANGLVMQRRCVLAAVAAVLMGGRLEVMATLATPPAGEPPVNAGGPVVVTGDVIFPVDLPAGPAAPIVVSVEDVSRADAPAVTLASAVIPASATPPVPGERVPFSIPISAYDVRMTYSVRAHVDRDGDGRVSSGDLISTTHNPVLTRGGGTVVDVPLSVVG